MVDTNSNPEIIDYPIPSNDDAFKSVAIITAEIGKAIEEALQERKKMKDEQKDKEAAAVVAEEAAAAEAKAEKVKAAKAEKAEAAKTEENKAEVKDATKETRLRCASS